ncbi:TspO/MBR-related protein [Niveomyces insectorum RCEF 264]|uniref:TspO/MBR-related protein n=1 Tax=Niveomyces insectorum RCEF 264 TaxID=1081102 RepID=A0A167U3S6_9HYPO|nr:TspO/MBR-related protein [Niveomyces insectorum RCEF 264]
MTTILRHLSLPEAVFTNPAASILVPVALGACVGMSAKPDPKDPTVAALKQPPLRPPPEVFAPVWTVLYGLMGYAAHRALGTPLAILRDGGARSPAAGLYTLQLGLNLAWMPLFATADAAALFAINAYLAARWLRTGDGVAGWCMLPYVAWLGFATYLSAGTGYLNGWSLGPSPGAPKAKGE